MAATGITVFRIAGGKVVEGWTTMDLSPTDEELRWLTEGGGWPSSGGIPSTERDPGTTNWDVLTRNLTWRLRVAEAWERERIEQELQVARRTQECTALGVAGPTSENTIMAKFAECTFWGASVNGLSSEAPSSLGWHHECR
jgi:hypothetical protein